MAQAHLYVLLHCAVIKNTTYVSLTFYASYFGSYKLLTSVTTTSCVYKNILRHQIRGRRSNVLDVDREFTKTFHELLGETVNTEKFNSKFSINVFNLFPNYIHVTFLGFSWKKCDRRS